MYLYLHTCRLSPLESVQRKVGESGSISIVKLKVET